MQCSSASNKSGKSRATTRLSEKVDKSLLAYTVAAAAAGVGLAASQPAVAEIVYTPTNVPLQGAGSGEPKFYSIDLNNDGITDFILGSFVGATTELTAHSLEVYPCYCKNPNAVVGTNRGRFPVASALPAGVQVGSNQQFITNTVFQEMAAIHVNRNMSSQFLSTTFLGPFANNGKGVRNHYLGFKFLINGDVHYGWARFTISLASFMTGYAYETVPDKPITTGFPKPGEARIEHGTVGEVTKQSPKLGALARGAEGLKTWRGSPPSN